MPRNAEAPRTYDELVQFALVELTSSQGARKTRIAKARKMFLGCVDCGYRRHPEALQFDHRPGEVKLGQISGWPGDIPSMLAEMEKCDVVCANCHAIRTALRREDAGAISARAFRRVDDSRCPRPTTPPQQSAEQQVELRVKTQERSEAYREKVQAHIEERLARRAARLESDVTGI